MNNIQMFLVSESERHVYYLLLEFMLIGRKRSWICSSSVGGHLRLSLTVMCWIPNFVFYSCIIYYWSIVLCVGILPKYCDKDGWILFWKMFLLSNKYTQIRFLRRIHMQESAALLHPGTTCFVVVVVVVLTFLFPWFILYETSNFCFLLHTSKSLSFFFLPGNFMSMHYEHAFVLGCGGNE